MRATDVDHQDFSLLHCFVALVERGPSALANAAGIGCRSLPPSAQAAGFSTATVIVINLSARSFFFEPVILFARSRDTSRKCHCACTRGSDPSGFSRR